jgi:hypothetical protein
MYSCRVRPSASRDIKARRVSDPVTMVSTAEYGTPVYPVPGMFPICPKAAGARLTATMIAQSMRMVTPLSINRCDSAQYVSHALQVWPLVEFCESFYTVRLAAGSYIPVNAESKSWVVGGAIGGTAILVPIPGQSWFPRWISCKLCSGSR